MYTKDEVKQAMNQLYVEAFSGNAQDVDAYDMGRAYESTYRKMELAELEARKKVLQDRIYSQEAQDEDAMYQLEDVEKDIASLIQYMTDYDLF